MIVATEQIVDEEFIRRDPRMTAIPFYLVDAVCEVPYGAHPVQMPYLYFFDEKHIASWLELSKTEEGTQEYLDRYVFGVNDFNEYLERVGGTERMQQLERIEELGSAGLVDDDLNSRKEHPK